jgi:hypothetical protein
VVLKWSNIILLTAYMKYFCILLLDFNKIISFNSSAKHKRNVPYYRTVVLNAICHQTEHDTKDDRTDRSSSVGIVHVQREESND